MDRIENQQAFNVDAKLAGAVRLHQDGRLLKAGRTYREILDRYPNHADTLHLAGLIAHQTGDDRAAVKLITKAVKIFQNCALYHNSLGMVFKALGEQDKAIASFRKAIAIHPHYAEAHYNLGAVLQHQNEFDRAIVCYQKSLEIQPDLSEAHASMGMVLQKRGEFEMAAASFRKAIAIRPRDAELYHHLGRVLENLGQLDGAIHCFRQALAIKPQHVEACNDMGLVFRQQGKFAEALSSLHKAVEIEPECVEAQLNLGNLLQDSGRLEQASECYRKALAIEPGFAKAYNNLGMAYQGMGKTEDAVACFHKAIEIRPNYASAIKHLVSHLQKDCSWSELATTAARLDRLTKAALDAGARPAEDPFLNLSRHPDPAHNLAVAKAWSTDICRRMAEVKPGFSFDGRRRRSKPITIGYLSNNFHDHPMAHLLLGLFSLHNRNQFKINCYSCGKADDSYYRLRIRQDCDKFVDLNDINHLDAARLIHTDQVDILVDLMGHTRGSRMEICALRPAPIQVRYLGLAGTTGADFFDYILTDKIVTPEAHAPYYSENFVYLPHCYQINDYKQADGNDWSAAGERELPPNRAVLCSFNQDYKIEPVMFDCWMRILRRVPDSILWLMVRHKAAKKHLRAEAQARGVDPERLIFLERRPKKQHLARLKMADLALDSRVVNGAATTSDALWAGVPVITLIGTHFASRMSASILTAAGLPELIAHSIQEYEALVVQIASDRNKLSALRQKLAKNNLTEPLFDTPRFVDNLEQAYNRMWQIFRAGDKPRRFEVLESPCGDRRNLAPALNRSGLAKKDEPPAPPAKRIAFFCGPNDSFLKDLVGHLSGTHEVRRFKGQTIKDMQELMEWSDLSWFEWCDQLVIRASGLPKVCHVICRLHSYEIFSDMPGQVNWKNVDDLIFVAPHIRDIAKSKIPDLEHHVRTRIIPNGVDMDKCRFSERGKGFDIAYVGYLNYKKNPALLLQCMRYLVDIDDRYILHIAGEHQEMRSKLYFDHMIKAMELEPHVKFHGWVNDIVTWLADKQYILSTSLLESFGYGIAEAMACGLKPLIHNFIGAKELYPAKYCFNSVKEFGHMILGCDYRPLEYRKYIEENYSREKQFQEIDRVMGSVRSTREKQI